QAEDGIRAPSVTGVQTCASSDLGPQVNPCTQILQAGGVRIDLKAQATGPRSVTITWSGPPGVYDVTATGPGPAFHVSTTLAPPPDRKSGVLRKGDCDAVIVVIR